MDSDKKITRHIFIVQYLYLKKVARKRIQQVSEMLKAAKFLSDAAQREQHLLAQAKHAKGKIGDASAF